MTGLFPGAVTSYTNPNATTDRTGIDVGGRTLDEFIADHNDDLEAIEAKLGISLTSPSNAPLANRLLGSNENAKSGWMQLLDGMFPDNIITARMVPANLITQVISLQQNSSVNVASVSYVDVMTQAITVSAGSGLLAWGAINLFVASGAPGDCWFSIRVDSGTDIDLDQKSQGNNISLYGTRLFTGLSAGSHTVALRQVNAAAGTYTTAKRTLTLLELKK